MALLGRHALESSEIDGLLDEAVATVAETLDVAFAAVFQRCDDGDDLLMRAGTGWRPGVVGSVVAGTGPDSLAGAALATATPLLVDDWKHEKRVTPSPVLLEHGIECSMSAVIRGTPRPFGVLATHTTQAGAFTDDDVFFLRAVTNVLAAALTRHAIEEELRNKEAEARLVLEAGHMGTWRWATDTDRMWWSAELEAVFGVEPGQFAGTRDAFVEIVHPDDRAMVTDEIANAVAHNAELSYEHRIVRPDGVVRWIDGRGRKIPSVGGEPDQWVGVGIDITERKAAEFERGRLLEQEHAARQAAEHAHRELEEALARLDALLEHASVGFAFFDTEFRFVRLNQPFADISGLDIADHLGKNIEDVLPALWTRVETEFREALATGEPVVDVEVSARTEAAPGRERHWLASSYPVVGRSGDVLGIGAVVVEVTALKRTERSTALIARANELFASSSDVDTVIDQATRLAIPGFADSCHLYLRKPDGSHRVRIAHVDPDLEARLVEADARWPLDRDRRRAGILLQGDGARLLSNVTPEMRAEMAEDEQHRQLLEEHGVVSAIAAPLQAGGRHLGALLFNYTAVSHREYDADDVRLAEDLATRFAQAIENARLATEAARARNRLTVLARLGELATIELDTHARLDAVAQSVLPAFAEACAVYLLDEDADRLRLVAVGNVDPSARAAIGEPGDTKPLPLDADVPACRTVREDRPVLVGETGPDDFRPSLDEREQDAGGRTSVIGSMICVPLHNDNGPMGALQFGSSEPNHYTEADVALAEEVARRIAPSVENARRFEREQAVAEMLQRSLLPEHLPKMPGVSVAARYVPAREEATVGGDWYDVIPLPGGAVLLAIGDVAGHGVRAAAAMGRIRNALQFCALDGLGPSQLLTRLNEHFYAINDADMATLLLVTLDTLTGSMRYASAGHPPPLVLRADGDLQYLQGDGGPPLCAAAESRFPETHAFLAAEDLLFLYTDGLIERRRESLDVGFGRLGDVLRNAPRDLEVLADDVLERLVGGSPADDVALLAVRPVDDGDTFEMWVSARPRELASLRTNFEAWLKRFGTTRAERYEIVVAVNEAAANAVEHAYGIGDAEFFVSARHDDGVVTVAVRDTGKWREPRPRGNRGRGLRMMEALMDHVDVEPAADGTAVRMERRLTGARE